MVFFIFVLVFIQDAMKKKLLILLIGVVTCLLVSCADRSTRAMRKAERQMEKQAAQQRKEYEKAKSAHYQHQAPKTKKMIREDKKRARQLNRHLQRR